MHTSNEELVPKVGDSITIARDVLVEFQPPARRAPRIWRFVPQGTRGRVIAEADGMQRVQLEPNRDVAYVRSRCLTRA